MARNDFTQIDPNTYEGGIPRNCELVVMEHGGDPEDGFVLMGFDELGEFDCEFKRPVTGFLEN